MNNIEKLFSVLQEMENTKNDTQENSLRDKIILESGYEVLRVSKLDYKNNKEEMINIKKI